MKEIDEGRFLEDGIKEIGTVELRNGVLVKEDMLKLLKLISHFGKVKTRAIRKKH
jgi:hypothetical protein